VNGSPKIRDFTVTSMFAAIIFVMTFSPIGFIPLGAMNATIIHVPVIIGAIVMGPRTGAFLGSLFGLASLIRATISPNLLSFVFSPLIPLPGTDQGSLWALLICFGPRVLVGITPYYTDKFFMKFTGPNPKWRFMSTFFAGMAGSMTNTILVMGLIFLIFKDAYASAVGSGAELVLGMIMTVVFAHGIPESLIAGIFTSAVCRALQSYLKRGTKREIDA
jgi:uncharacterized membrane protein